MLVQRHVPQPSTDYRELFRIAGRAAEFDEVAAAFAYGTRRGADLLIATLAGVIPGFSSASVTKRWLLGIDWCRTEPQTFDILRGQSASSVRVHDGEFVVARAGCPPRLPWHPKVLLLRGPSAVAVITGSGNMSQNGLTRGHEAGTVTVVAHPNTSHEREVDDSCRAMFTWFESVWRPATRVNQISTAYAGRFAELAKVNPPVTDGDTLPSHVRAGWTEERIRKLRTAKQLWIDAGNLHHNRGAGLPGNQLMLTAMTRVFFDFPAADLPTDSTLGDVAVRYGGYLRPDCSLRYSNNSMDVLTLPVPGHGGPPSYDQEALLFTRGVENGRAIYELRLGTTADRRAWIRASKANGAAYQMQGSPRQWGVIP